MRLPVAISSALGAILLGACATPDEPPGDRGEPAPAMGSAGHPFGSGSVEFVGFSAAELRDIRVIPEEGDALFVPEGGTRIEGVDGFWWRHSRQWFKIPDHCHAEITKGAGGLRSSPDCDGLGVRLQRMRGGLPEPDWQDDAGNSGHPTDYPFD